MGWQGAAIGGGLDFLGAIGTSVFNARQAAKQRKWAEKFYKHRYQWQMKDMAKAGLNPILMSTSGAGSVPAGATARGEAPSGNFSARGVQAQLAREQVKLMRTQSVREHYQAWQAHRTAQKESALTEYWNTQANAGAKDVLLRDMDLRERNLDLERRKAEAAWWRMVGAGGHGARAAAALGAGALGATVGGRMIRGVGRAYRRHRMKLKADAIARRGGRPLQKPGSPRY